jgi:hypothetical protein
MAEFTAENFVSRGSELQISGAYGSEQVRPNPGFPYPNGAGKSMAYGVPVTLTTDSGGSVSGQVDFVVGSTIDLYSNTSIQNLRMAATSLLDPYLPPGFSRLLGENSLVCDDELTVLVPRGIAFSTGLINHFFRGRLNLRRAAPTGTNWYIENTSNSPNAGMVGAFSIYTEDAAGNRNKVPEGPWNLVIPTGSSSTVSFSEPAAGTKNLVVVFKGQMGSEPANLNDGNGYATAGRVVPYGPPSSCTARSDSGSSSGISYTKDLGSAAGTVEVQFEAYAIPDGLRVKYANGHTPDPIAYTGLISGYKDITFAYDPV